jgi:predicted SPOUT superfamily RNA methylase MTH1
MIGRASAIFRVNEIIVYPDIPRKDQAADMNLLGILLSYMETPQYLRKRLFKIKPELQFAGILPPLRTSHHPLNDKAKNLKAGEFREGVTLLNARQGTFVDIGVEKPALLKSEALQINKRVTVQITRVSEQVEVKLTDPNQIETYWGYSVRLEKQTFAKMITKGSFDLTIATSKYAPPFSEVLGKIAGKWKDAERILIAFGAPTQGLHEIVKAEGLKLEEIVDFVVNMIPSQGTETVRTEEALMASLAVLNVNFGL